ncbi:hypothetical protein KUTeg_012128 [Tegillarca granosa]|uniref:Intimal thickness related receptor IRP domain-containing protein n=1 Tax=Tegillarca granosa TaxID=220873 RepID=A0ABQ9EYN3_TEGGR|nr:hypothetical protein KUTeg_012128 [Tegillarca granosa]
MFWFYFILSQFFIVVYTKTVTGTFSTTAARESWGQHITTFCFHGNALVNFTLNTTGDWNPTLYLYPNEDFRNIFLLEDSDCLNKVDAAKISHELTTKNGNFTLDPSNRPKLWHLVFADRITCEDDDATLNRLLRFYQLLTLAYFVLGCIFAPRLYESLRQDGPMQLVIKLITVSTGLQAMGGFIMMIHLQRYSKDGIGSPFVELLAELFDVLSQFAMLYMLLSLSFGWKFGTSFSHLQVIRKKPAARIVGAVLFVWEQIQDDDHRMYHAHRSYAGIALVLLRIMLAALFAWNLNVTVSSERSALRREFYKSFTKSCMLWFLCYPLIVVLSWLFSEYLRYKLITMGVVLCQCAAVAMLYRLFLSRSLYWEISALSSALPLRIDRSFSLKVYS